MKGFNASKALEILRKRYSDDPSALFNYEDANFQGLVRFVEGWRPKDRHLHISHCMNVSEFIVPKYLSKSDSEKRQIRKKGKEYKIPDWAWDDARTLSPCMTALNAYDRMNGKASARDIVIRSIDDFGDAVKSVADHIFDRGVSYFELRFSPFKRYGGVEGILRSTINALEKSKDRHPRCDAKIDLCFDRSNERYSPEKILEVMRQVAAMDKEIRCRISGLDISGQEILIPEDVFYPTQDYHESYAIARDLGLKCLAHLGDFRIYDDLKTRKTCMDHITKADFEVSVIEKYLDAFESAINGVSLDRIAHALAAGYRLPQELTGQIDKEGRVYDKRRINRLERKMDDLRSIVKEKGIIIESCPGANLRSHSVEDYRQHPIHGWLDEGIPIYLCVDATEYFPTTLAREVVKVAISSPYGHGLDIYRRTVR